MGELVKNAVFQWGDGIPPKVMVVDDQPHSLLHAVDLLIYQGCEVVECDNSLNVLSLALAHQPDVILMDIFMPERDGLTLAQDIKNDSRVSNIPVILMTVTEEPILWQKAHSTGIGDILLKPLDESVLGNRLRALTEQKRLNERLFQTQRMLFNVAQAVDKRNRQEEDKKVSLTEIMTNFAQFLRLGSCQIEDLIFASYLHDIGMVNIPDHILLKSEPLTANEKDLINQHVLIGEKICQPLYQRPSIMEIIRHHHEKWDGSGYPDHLQGDTIPFLTQVFQIVDIYYALITPQSYKPAYSKGRALDILLEEVSKGWRNPDLVNQFIRFLGFETQLSD